jgi:hypothetical protein
MSENGSVTKIQLSKSLDHFQTSLKSSCVDESLAEQLTSLANKAQGHITAGRLREADSVLSTSLLTIKRHLGTELNLRQGFVLSSVLVEEVRLHIADPAVLFKDAGDFATSFFEIYSNNRHRGAGLPDFLMKRPFPKGYKDAASTLNQLIESFELPDDQRATLINDIRVIEKHIPAFAKGNASIEDLYVHNGLMTTLCFDLLDLQGVYLSEYQVSTVLGMLIFAVPAWLCAAPPAWIVQALMFVVGGIFFAIISKLSTPPAKTAYKNMWIFVEDCTHTVKEVLDRLSKETKDLSDEEKKGVKEALEASLQKVIHDEVPISGERRKVILKLRALIAAL